MSKTPNYDAKVKIILDATQPGERTCEMTGEKWFMDEEEISWFRRFNVPPSPFSRKVRLWHNAAFYTVFQWWWNKNFYTGEPVLTYAHPASGIRVLPDKEWFAKDFSEINLSYSSDRPFFEVFRELQLSVPVDAMRNSKDPGNSIATVSLGDVNSFFVTGCRSKNCFYCLDCLDSEDSLDLSAGNNISEGFNISHSSRLNRCQFIFESYDCLNSSFLFDCRNCEFCFGATNQRNKKYLLFNKQLTKEVWEIEVAKINLGSYQELEKYKTRFIELVKNEAVWPDSFGDQTQNCTGDYLNKCSECTACFYGYNAHDNYYCYGVYDGQGNAFSTAIPGGNNYQMVGSGSSNCKFCPSIMRCDDLEYSWDCNDCEHCFGCVGLFHKKFHIFNRPYSEEEYWQKVDELKCKMLERGEYGRPVPMDFSPSYFPESGLVMYLGAEMGDWDKTGLKKFAASADGAYGESRMVGKAVASIDQIPDDIKDLNPAEWLGRPIADPVTGRPYTLLKPEIEFYIKYNLAAPRKHFVSRIKDLMLMMNTGWIENKQCHGCQKEISVAVNKTFKDKKVFCHDCYLKYLEANN
ncbi:MAG: hypothetical protein V1664_01555 [Candidatus Uhrbacteria bacterium]